MKDLQILLTNDDGIMSPGLWAAASALSELGYVHVVAPREQSSGAGRGMPSSSDGVIQRHEVPVNGKLWPVYAVGGSPTQTVMHALLEILPGRPDLVVSGINYGENVGSCVLISGTVGAALEAAAMGCPALAVSLETDLEHQFSLSEMVDFSTAAYFAAFFGRLIMGKRLPPDVDVLKIEVPADATPQTPWEVTRLSHQRYYEPIRPERQSLETPGRLGFRLSVNPDLDPPDTDIYALRVKRVVSVTPLSQDITSRVGSQDVLKFLCDS